MKYNPRICNRLAMLPEFSERHPLGTVERGQGFLQCMFELQEMLKAVTGMSAISLTPMAGAQGEFAGVTMIRAYHRAAGDEQRRQIIVPDAAHGTNPATATMCGCAAVEIPTGPDGDVDLDDFGVGIETWRLSKANDIVKACTQKQDDICFTESQRAGAEETTRMILRHHPTSLRRGEERNAGGIDKLLQFFARIRP